MRLATALKNAMLDIWDELLLLAGLNIVWCVGALLIIPMPLVTFGLYFVIKDLGEGKVIKFKDFFNYARETWKQAYLWAGINLVVVGLLLVNLRFYAGFVGQWALVVGMLMVALLTLWLVLQVIVLAIYPRLDEPGFRLALRNGLIITGRNPLAMTVLVAIMAAVVFISTIFPAMFIIISIVLIVAIANRIVDEAVVQELKREAG
ncbi:MAG: hypothetical protein R3264_00230 [Anaerolineae bacterium]|nr:hypothetical protein [Anaerolineae bacterium]